MGKILGIGVAVILLGVAWLELRSDGFPKVDGYYILSGNNHPQILVHVVKINRLNPNWVLIERPESGNFTVWINFNSYMEISESNSKTWDLSKQPHSSP